MLFPTLTWIALDILPCQELSVPCECLFSVSKQTADLHRSSLGVKHFEKLQIIKFAWRRDLPDHVAYNWAQVEEVQLGEYSDILEADGISAEWDMKIIDDMKFILEYKN